VTYDEVSRISTLVQAGGVVGLSIGTKIHDVRYGIGLMCFSPLGALSGLILTPVLSSTCLTIRVAVRGNLHVFEVISFLIGLRPFGLFGILGVTVIPFMGASSTSCILGL